MDLGCKNTLADSLSRLLEVDPEAKLQQKKGHEFGTFSTTIEHLHLV